MQNDYSNDTIHNSDNATIYENFNQSIG